MKHIALIVLLLWSTYGQADPPVIYGGFPDANSYQQLDEADQQIFIVGLVAGISLFLPEKQFDCFSPRLADNQLHSMVKKQLAENPGDWHLGMQAHLYRLIAGVCPV